MQQATTDGSGCTSEHADDHHYSSLEPATEHILEAATKFLWDDMKETLETFCANHASLFAGVADSVGRNRLAENTLRDILGVGPAAGPLGSPAGGGLGAFRTVKAPEVEGEQRLEWTQAHRDFQELFEHVLESFIESQPFSTEEFVAACRDALHRGGWTNPANCRAQKMAEAILAMPDYNNFIRMMIEATQQLHAQAEAEHSAGIANDAWSHGSVPDEVHEGGVE